MDLNNNNNNNLEPTREFPTSTEGKENEPEVDEAGPPFSKNSNKKEGGENFRSFFADCSIDEDGSFTFQRNWPSLGKKITLSPEDSESLLNCLYDVMNISKETLDKYDGTIVKKRECTLVDDNEHKITCYVERSPVND